MTECSISQSPGLELLISNMPANVRGICGTQYCAVALMLAGYSLEVCLKAMIVLREGGLSSDSPSGLIF